MHEREVIHSALLVGSADGEQLRRLWRNNQGLSKFVRGGQVYKVAYGIPPGSGGSDLLGFRSMKITEEMVGQIIAQFVAVEAKGSRGKPSPAQLKFLRLVQRAGGLALLVYPDTDLRALMEDSSLGSDYLS